MNAFTRIFGIAVGSMFALTACSGEDPNGSLASEGDETPAETAQYRQLDQAELDEVILDIQDMPEGWSVDPEETESEGQCGWTAPEEGLGARASFLRGGGFEQEAAILSIRQYESEPAAQEDFDAFVEAISNCGTEDGVTYSVASAPDVGDEQFGMAISTEDGASGTQYVSRVGPVIIGSAVAGLLSVDTDGLTPRLRAQVKAYREAAVE